MIFKWLGKTEQVYIYPQNEADSEQGIRRRQCACRWLVARADRSLEINRGDEKTPSTMEAPNGGTDYATNIYSLEGQMRLTAFSHGLRAITRVLIVLDPDVAGGGAVTTKIYKVPLPNQADMARQKAYVDHAVRLPIR